MDQNRFSWNQIMKKEIGSMFPVSKIIRNGKAICLIAIFVVLVTLAPNCVLGDCQGNCRDFDPAGYPTHVEDADSDGYTIAQGDCNDLDPLEFPGQQWYKDQDNDGYSDGTILIDCERPTSYKAEIELSLISGDLNDQIPDPQLASAPGINEVQPTILISNRQVTITGSSFGEFQGSGFVNFYQNTRPTQIISWNDNTITLEISPAVLSGCVEIVTVFGKSDCVDYTVGRPLPWLLLLQKG